MIGKRVKTYNQVVPFIDFLMLREGEINPASVVKLITGLVGIICIISLIILAIQDYGFIVFICIFRPNKVNEILDKLEVELNKSAKYKDELKKFREQELSNERKGGLISKAMFIRTVRDLKNSMEEFEDGF